MTRSTRSIASLALLGCCLLASCSDPVSVPSPETKTANIELKSADINGLLEIVKASHGKVVLVDFWATWCKPCRQQFSHTVKLHEQHEKDGLVVVSVSLDDADYRDSAAEFLKSQGATFTNLISQDGGSQAAYEGFQISALPFYAIFDAQGQRHDLTSEDPEKSLTPEALDQKVADFLSQRSGT